MIIFKKYSKFECVSVGTSLLRKQREDDFCDGPGMVDGPDVLWINVTSTQIIFGKEKQIR